MHKWPWGCVVGWTWLLFSLKNGPHLPRGSCLYGEALLYGEWCSAVVALGCWWCSVLWLVISTFTLCCVFQLWYVLLCFQLLFCVSQSWFYLMERFIFGSSICVMHNLVHNLNPYLPDVLTEFVLVPSLPADHIQWVGGYGTYGSVGIHLLKWSIFLI